jgi:hypothetical protein
MARQTNFGQNELDRAEVINQSNRQKSLIDNAARSTQINEERLLQAENKLLKLKRSSVEYQYENASLVRIIGFIFVLLIPFVMIGTSILLNYDSIELIVGKDRPNPVACYLIPIGTFLSAIVIRVLENSAREKHQDTRIFTILGWILLFITPIFILSVEAYQIESIPNHLSWSSSLVTLGKILLIVLPEVLVLYAAHAILISLGFFTYHLLRPFYDGQANRIDRNLEGNRQLGRESFNNYSRILNQYNNLNPDRPVESDLDETSIKFVNDVVGYTAVQPRTTPDQVIQPPVNDQPAAPITHAQAPNPAPQETQTQAPPASPAPTPVTAPSEPAVNNNLEEYYQNQAAAMVRKADGEVQL